ncbi:hypothetical protein ISCGN_009772 [Ixodes scapularis]
MEIFMSWLRMDAEILVSCEAAVSAVAIFEAETRVPLAERDSSEPISRRTCCGWPRERGDVYSRITYSRVQFSGVCGARRRRPLSSEVCSSLRTLKVRAFTSKSSLSKGGY